MSNRGKKKGEDIKKQILELIKRNKIENLPNNLRFDSDLFDIGSAEIFNRTPQLLYTNKKSADEIRRMTLPAPFQPIEEFGESKEEEFINKLIWGDNAQAIKHLINDGFKGKVRLIYIDPPFATKSDFSKGEVKAYRDKLAGGDFIEFIRERLVLLKELLAEDGGIYVHLDSKMNSYIRVIMDEIFGKENFVNEIVWKFNTGGASTTSFSKKHNTIYFYSKTAKKMFNPQREPYREENANHFDQKDDMGRAYRIREINGKEYKYYLDRGRICHDTWDINSVNAVANERTDYPTQKPEKLLERIIKASSNEGDIVLDAFCGSGTTLAVAEKLGRKWIGVDAGKVAIYTTKKRILDLSQHQPFTLLNSGIYEMKELNGGQQVNIDEKLYKEFACALFGIDTTQQTKEKGVQYDGVGRGNIKAKVLKPRGFITRTYLKQLAKHIGKGKVYIIYSQNQDRVIANQLEIDGVKFYLHKIPHSLIAQVVYDCVDGDISKITRNLQDIILCKNGEVDKKELNKLGKIIQPKSKKELEQKFTNIAGFDFVDTTNFDVDIKVKKLKDKITFEIGDVITPYGKSIENLSLILADTEFNGKVLKADNIFWAENYTEEYDDSTKKEVIGFIENKGFEIIKGKKKEIAIVFIDDFGNELIKIIEV